MPGCGTISDANSPTKGGLWYQHLVETTRLAVCARDGEYCLSSVICEVNMIQGIVAADEMVIQDDELMKESCDPGSQSSRPDDKAQGGGMYQVILEKSRRPKKTQPSKNISVSIGPTPKSTLCTSSHPEIIDLTDTTSEEDSPQERQQTDAIKDSNL